MEIKRAFIVKEGDSRNNRIHVITSDDNEGWRIVPSLGGDDWNYRGAGNVRKVDWRCPSDWISHIQNGKGCVGTFIQFSNGEVVVL